VGGPYLGRAGRLSTPTGVWIKRGAKSPVGFEAGVGLGRIRGPSSLVGTGTGTQRGGLLVPWTSTPASALNTSNRDLHAGSALFSPGPFGCARGGIGCANRDLAGRCRAGRNGSRKPTATARTTIPDQDPHKIPLSARSATSDDA
jgi:hypothetical protein